MTDFVVVKQNIIKHGCGTVTALLPMSITVLNPGGGGGYSLYSNDRDDHHIFRVILIINDLVF